MFLSNNSYWWSSTECYMGGAWYRVMGYCDSSVDRYNDFKEEGFSVRCVRD
jgi:uncharacterized protein (TIGR02145 family)